MFCDTCHWYTAGEKICPHCGAEQKPPEPDAIFGIRRPEPKPKPEPAPPPVPEAPPLPPEPPPVAAPLPAPRPIPPPSPTPVPSGSKPAPAPSGGNTQGIKALALVLIGVVVLVIVLFFVEMSREDAYYASAPDYDDSYFETAEPSLEEAQAGDLVFLDDAQWWVLVAGEHALLLLMEDEIYLEPEEVVGYLDENGMFLLSPEEMAAYGFPPPEDRYDQLTSLRPAKWVTVR